MLRLAPFDYDGVTAVSSNATTQRRTWILSIIISASFLFQYGIALSQFEGAGMYMKGLILFLIMLGSGEIFLRTGFVLYATDHATIFSSLLKMNDTLGKFVS